MPSTSRNVQPAPSPGIATDVPATDPTLVAAFAATAYPGSLRRYQELALAAFERARASGDQRLYLTMPPGSGKTLVGLEVARRMARPTLVLAPNTAIVGQWIAQWGAFAPPTVAAHDSTDLGAPVTVLTYQALCVLERGVDDPDAEEAPDVDPAEAAADAAMIPEPGTTTEPATTAGDGMAGAAGTTGAAATTEMAAPAEMATPAGPTAVTPGQRRRLIARGGDRVAVLGLLHANGRAIVERLAANGPMTLILDESHHLMELWGSLLAAVLETLGPDTFVVALTATPPQDLGPREARLHDELFGAQADFGVVAPAVVKDGWLAPYQELALLTEPLADERRFIDEQGEQFAALLREVQGPDLASLPFSAWLERRVEQRRSPEGAPVAWQVLEHDDSALARAALRLRWSQDAPPPHGARYAEIHRRPPDADDWAALLGRWATEALAPSTDPRDASAWDRLKADLPSVGYRLAHTGAVRSASVVDHLLSLSGSKALAAAAILSAEHAALGDRLRGLVLCDHESAGRDPGVRLRGVLDPGAGSAVLVLRTLLDGSALPGLDPVLVTGRTVACSRGTAERLVRFAAREADLTAAATPGAPAPTSLLAGSDPLAAAAPRPPVATSGAGADGWSDVVLVDPPDPRWSSRTWVPLLTRFLAVGGTRCLVGTRALLGEGWDSPPVNVVIDLTTATTRAAVHQMRGRGMRLDRADPAKLADLWDVACVVDGHPQGAADHARFARKHEHDLAVGATGEIESGVSHVDPLLTPFAPPTADERAALRTRMLARPGSRDAVRAAWRIGEPYRDVPVGTVRVRTGRSPGTPVRDPLRHLPAVQARRAGSLVPRTILGALAAGLIVGVVVGPVAGLVAALLILLLGSLAGLALVGRGIGALDSTDLLGDLGRAVADALVATELVDPSAGAAAVRVVAQPDGWYRCLLDGASTDDSSRFAEAFEQLLAPLWDPRWLMPRPVLVATPDLVGAARLVGRRVLGRGTSGVEVWHAVPDLLASRQDRVAAFTVAWRRWVAPGAAPVRAGDPMGEAVLAARRGDDPFQTETQLRTLWT